MGTKSTILLMDRFRDLIEQFRDTGGDTGADPLKGVKGSAFDIWAFDIWAFDNRAFDIRAFDTLAIATGEKHETVKGWYRRDFIHSALQNYIPLTACNSFGAIAAHTDDVGVSRGPGAVWHYGKNLAPLTPQHYRTKVEKGFLEKPSGKSGVKMCARFYSLKLWRSVCG